MFPLRLPAILLVLAALAGCAPSSPPSPGVSTPGAMQLAVRLPLAAPADVARVTVTVSGSDMASRTTDLALTDGAWGGILSELPAGTQRTFLAQAFSSAHVLRYEGRADNVTVTAGATGLVSLTLLDVSPPPPFTNEAPLVDSLVASVTTVAPGGSLTLTATAHDPNPGDPLSYSWSAPSGTFSAPTQASTQWTAPSAQGPVVLTLKVSDSRGASLAANLTVNVSAGGGAAEVKVGFNTAPRVVSLSASQSLLDVGQQTLLSVSATDGDGDSLLYQWSATCAGSFTGATTASASFTPSVLPTAACNNCQLSVVVKDGRGGQSTGTLAMCVARDPRAAPPTLTRSYQSSLTARAGQQLTFEVGASDPAGSALSFAWTANVGTPGTASTGPTSSRLTWTAPACVGSGTPPSLTATVSNAFGQQTTRKFTVTGLPSCPAGWTAASPMSCARSGHTATRLSTGKVLVVGGGSGACALTAEVYDPAPGTWSPTGSLTTRRGSAATVLLSNGKVLTVGGTGSAGVTATAEVYDPATGTWSSTGSLVTRRFQHGAVLLPTGKVLIAGGRDSNSTALATAEVYDPATGTWSPTGAMAQARNWYAMTSLSNGKVLVAGGYNNSTYLAEAEVYDPATGTWSPTGSMSSARVGPVLTLLSTGKVLAVGGGSLGAFALATAEVYDPATGTWSPTGSLLTGRNHSMETRLADGRVLITGGRGSDSNPSLAEVYDPATGTWSSAGNMSSSRTSHTSTLLPSGKVLVTGGFSNEDMTLADLYDPATGP